MREIKCAICPNQTVLFRLFGVNTRVTTLLSIARKARADFALYPPHLTSLRRGFFMPIRKFEKDLINNCFSQQPIHHRLRPLHYGDNYLKVIKDPLKMPNAAISY